MGLFQPIWMSKKYKDESKAIQAVRRISDSDKLLRIAFEAPLEEVAAAAVEGIRDEAVLCRLALSAAEGQPGEPFEVFKKRQRDSRVAVDAVQKIRNGALLNQIALSSKNEKVQRAAISRIEDQALLLKLALEADNKYAADDAARKVQEPEFVFKLAMSGRECAVHGAYRVSDPAEIRKVALNAPTEEARYAAMTHVTDADTLLTILEREPNRRTREQACLRLRFDFKEKAQVSESERERLVQLFLHEPEDGRFLKPVMSITILDDPEDLRRVAREAVRIDHRMDAMNRLAAAAGGEVLWQLYKDADALARSISDERKRRPCRDVQRNIEIRVGSDEKMTPVLLMRILKDQETGCDMASECVKALFRQSLDGYEGIDALREEAVTLFLAAIPHYARMSNGHHNEKYCILALAPQLPPAARERFGFKVWGEEREDEDQYGRNTVNVTYVDWKGRIYSYP